jgi:uncharacterized coiled-coil protein SlyX
MAKIKKIDIDTLGELSRRLTELATKIKTLQDQLEVVMSGMEDDASDFRAGEISKKVYDSNVKDFTSEKTKLEAKINETVDDIIVNVLKKQVEVIDAQSIGKKPPASK